VKGVKLESLDERGYFHQLCLPSALGTKRLRRDLRHAGDGCMVAVAGIWSVLWAMCLRFILLHGPAAIKIHMHVCLTIISFEHQRLTYLKVLTYCTLWAVEFELPIYTQQCFF